MRKYLPHETVRSILKFHGRTFAEELGLNITENTPEALFGLLCATLLFSTRISAKIALKAAAALAREGWITPRALLNTKWEDRVRVLDAAGYVRYDERTATRLEELAAAVLERYGGDLRNLRERAGRDYGAERRQIKEFKGIGDTGADIFFREVQAVWEEVYPFADKKALHAAKKCGLETDVRYLSRKVSRKDFPRLVAALVRVELEGDYEKIKNISARG